MGPLWPTRSLAWQRQVKRLGQGQDAGLNGEGAILQALGRVQRAEPRHWAVERTQGMGTRKSRF